MLRFRFRHSGWPTALLLRLSDPFFEDEGLASLDVNLMADTAWEPDIPALELLLRHADGYIDAAVWPERADADLIVLWTANLVFALLPAPTVDGKSRLNCVVAAFEADNGVLKANTAIIDSTETIVRGRGSINLNEGERDLLVTPQAKREKFLSASTPIRVTGPLNSFEVGVVPGGLLGTAMKWYTSLVYVPYKWVTGKRFPADGVATCLDAMRYETTPQLDEYLRARDFSKPPPRVE